MLVGDIVNKGPSSAGVVALARAQGFAAVRGNHDDTALFAWEDRQPGGRAATPDAAQEICGLLIERAALFLAFSAARLAKCGKPLPNILKFCRARYWLHRDTTRFYRWPGSVPATRRKATVAFVVSHPKKMVVTNQNWFD